MTLSVVLVLLAIALVCAVLGQLLSGYSVGSLVVAIGVGFVGALLGIRMADLLALPLLYTVNVDGTVFPVVWAAVGSALLVAAIGAFAGGKRW